MSAAPRGMAVLYDATRLIARRRAPAPTGIDRVDLRYAQEAVAGRWGPCCLVAQVRDRLVAVPRLLGQHLVANLAERWQAGGPGNDLDPPLREAGLIGQDPPSERIRAAEAEAHVFALRYDRAFYLNTSHHGVGNAELFLPLIGRLGAGFAFLVHDLIPIEYPEYVRPGDRDIHAQRMRVVAELGSLVIANSDATRRAFEVWTAAEQLIPPPITVAHLGLEPVFLERSPPPECEHPYFVCVGTIEPRKNHVTLLQLWRALARDLPAQDIPRLVLIGRRGWECAHITALLDRCEALRPFVLELSSLSDREMLSWIAGARALLFPSFSEGWGLPLVEALAHRVPVLCSDLPVFEEASQGLADRLDPLDAGAWRARILELSREDTAKRAARRDALARFDPPRWDAHFAVVDRAFTELATRGTAPRLARRAMPVAPLPSEPAPSDPLTKDVPPVVTAAADAARDLRLWPSAAAAFRTAVGFIRLAAHGTVPRLGRLALPAATPPSALRSKNFAAAVAAGDAARDLRDWPRAATAYRAAIAIDPEQAAIWVQLGHMLKEAGDLAGANDAYDQALRLAPTDADLHLQLGHLCKTLGRLHDAGAWYEAALGLDPGNRDAAEHAAWVRERLGRRTA